MKTPSVFTISHNALHHNSSSLLEAHAGNAFSVRTGGGLLIFSRVMMMLIIIGTILYEICWKFVWFSPVC